MQFMRQCLALLAGLLIVIGVVPQTRAAQNANLSLCEVGGPEYHCVELEGVAVFSKSPVGRVQPALRISNLFHICITIP